LKSTLIDVRRLVTRRRGDCFGALVAGFMFIALAPGTEDPTAFHILGAPLLVAGAILSVIAVAFPAKQDRVR
jgi:hypothetical protein